ncbi:MAG: cytochrome c biogenesis protein CcsA [Marinilabiliaceae bacterium]|nr:cytochrome c biogenesis protein CcsA [Marinilabiliaceae bacterium]
MNWGYFVYFALASILCWTMASWIAIKRETAVDIEKQLVRKPFFSVGLLTIAGLVIFFTFIIGMWVSLERPPLRTMGETRLWYSFFLPLAGLIIYLRWQYKWILSFSTLMSAVFIGINLFKPEIHSKTLMPALQSPWFAPHVIVYMFCYALLGAAFVMALYLLFCRKGLDIRREMITTDNLVYVGLSFMTFGMLFGALWAKEAWGHYWSWDPKETWAAVTWLFYLVYLHFRIVRPDRRRTALVMLLISFCCLQMCWWGINYLPSAQGISIHTYNLD